MKKILVMAFCLLTIAYASFTLLANREQPSMRGKEQIAYLSDLDELRRSILDGAHEVTNFIYEVHDITTNRIDEVHNVTNLIYEVHSVTNFTYEVTNLVYEVHNVTNRIVEIHNVTNFIYEVHSLITNRIDEIHEVTNILNNIYNTTNAIHEIYNVTNFIYEIHEVTNVVHEIAPTISARECLKANILSNDVVVVISGIKYAGDSYYIDWGDGNSTENLTNSSVSHSYSNGTYTLSFSDNITTFNSTIENIRQNYSSVVWDILCFPSKMKNLPMNFFGDFQTVNHLVIPEGIQNIGEGSFSDNYSVKHINIPNSVTNFGEDTFECCNHLTNVTIGAGIKTYCVNAFYETYPCILDIDNLSDWCKSNFSGHPFGSSDFMYTFQYGLCKLFVRGEEVKSLVIPEDVETINPRAFYTCSAISSLYVPENVSRIREYAFAFNNALENITIENGGCVLETNSFYNVGFGNVALFGQVWSLTNITFGAGMTSIPFSSGIFGNADKLETLTMKDSVAPLNLENYSNAFIRVGTKATGAKKLRIPQGATGYTEGVWQKLLDNGFEIEYFTD